MHEPAYVLKNLVAESKAKFFFVNLSSVASIVNNLKFVYHSVVASENLLACAIERLRVLEEDSYSSLLLAYFIEHLEEEREHDKWLADDLKSHGVNISKHDENAMAMIGSQYYMIFHSHPSCLLGYMAVVEGTPTPIEEIEKLEKIYGRKLFRFARFHSIKDEEHKVNLFDIIDKTPVQLVGNVFLSAEVALKHMAAAAKYWN